MENRAVEKLIESGVLDGKRNFTTNLEYRRFLRPNKSDLTLKPDGLWYGVDDSWYRWCLSESFGGIGTYIYEIKLRPKTNILFLDTKQKVLSFSKEYARTDDIFAKMNSTWIDWARVMADFDGIDVNPYFYDMRFEFGLMWYYGWDVPSGCVWRGTAVKSVSLVAQYDKRKKAFKIK